MISIVFQYLDIFGNVHCSFIHSERSSPGSFGNLWAPRSFLIVGCPGSARISTTLWRWTRNGEHLHPIGTSILSGKKMPKIQGLPYIVSLCLFCGINPDTCITRISNSGMRVKKICGLSGSNCDSDLEPQVVTRCRTRNLASAKGAIWGNMTGTSMSRMS